MGKELKVCIMTGISLMLMLYLSIVVQADVEINEETFQDGFFREYVSVEFDKDNDGVLSIEETDMVTTIAVDFEQYRISSFAGIEYFGNLKKLVYSRSYELSSLDLSKNTALEYLVCSYNNLTSLDLSKNTALEYLDCRRNNLSSLDVSNNTALKSLVCSGNKLSRLDVSNNTALEGLLCSDNYLSSLDVGNNATLVGLYCSSNNLSSLDVSNNTALEGLDCSKNHLSSLDVSNNTALVDLDCARNNLSRLDVSNNMALKDLNCSSNNLSSLDVSNNAALKDLNCSSNNLSSLDVSNNISLLWLYCSSNNLASLDVSNCLKSPRIEASSNIYPLVTESKSIDLTMLPGFDVSKASAWTNGIVEGNILTVNNNGEVSYTYDCGNGKTAVFTLDITIDEIIPMDEPDLILPESLTVVEEEAFMNTSASVVSIPDKVTSIGERAFYGSSLLRQVYIPSSVTTIGDESFSNCAESLIVYGEAGSYAESWADENEYMFMPVK